MTDTFSEILHEQKEKLFAFQQETVCRNTDRIFKWLLLLQWLVGIVLTLHVSPLTWAGESSKVHPHVWASLVLGGII
ncbi:MAG: chemotaxis protein, partial [Verrucomicrobiaceae bacterium]